MLSKRCAIHLDRRPMHLLEKIIRSCVEDFLILFHSFVSPTQGKIIFGLMSHRNRKGFPWITPFNIELRSERKTQKSSAHKFMWSRWVLRPEIEFGAMEMV